MTIETIRKAKAEDIEFLIHNARAEDIEELQALDGSTIRNSLNETPNLLENSEVWEVNGEVICIFGVTPVYDNKSVGVIWMLATEKFHEYAAMFAVKCKKVIARITHGYEYVFNYVYSENKTSVKWLAWLGFKIHDPEPIGRQGANFHKFDMVNV